MAAHPGRVSTPPPSASTALAGRGGIAGASAMGGHERRMSSSSSPSPSTTAPQGVNQASTTASSSAAAGGALVGAADHPAPILMATPLPGSGSHRSNHVTTPPPSSSSSHADVPAAMSALNRPMGAAPLASGGAPPHALPGGKLAALPLPSSSSSTGLNPIVGPAGGLAPLRGAPPLPGSQSALPPPPGALSPSPHAGTGVIIDPLATPSAAGGVGGEHAIASILPIASSGSILKHSNHAGGQSLSSGGSFAHPSGSSSNAVTVTLRLEPEIVRDDDDDDDAEGKGNERGGPSMRHNYDRSAVPRSSALASNRVKSPAPAVTTSAEASPKRVGTGFHMGSSAMSSGGGGGGGTTGSILSAGSTRHGTPPKATSSSVSGAGTGGGTGVIRQGFGFRVGAQAASTGAAGAESTSPGAAVVTAGGGSGPTSPLGGGGGGGTSRKERRVRIVSDIPEGQ